MRKYNYFQHLQVPKELVEIQHEESYISKTYKKKHFRKIYKNVEYNEFERTKIQELKDFSLSKGYNIPQEFDDSQLLQFLYNSQFKQKEVLQVMKDVQIQREVDCSYDNLPQEAQKILNDGIFYQYGRDFQLRPILIIDFKKLEPKKMNTDNLIKSLSCILYEIQANMYIEGKIENWIIILDFDGRGLMGLPMKLVQKMADTLSKNFCENLEKMYITNPSSSLKFLWGAISSFLGQDILDKISFVKSKKEFLAMQETIPADQLEKKFYGKAENQEVRFPPQNTLPKTVDELRNNQEIIIGKKVESSQKSIKVSQKFNKNSQIPLIKKADSNNKQNNKQNEFDNISSQNLISQYNKQNSNVEDDSFANAAYKSRSTQYTQNSDNLYTSSGDNDLVDFDEEYIDFSEYQFEFDEDFEEIIESKVTSRQFNVNSNQKVAELLC